MLIDELKKEFKEVYKHDSDSVYYSPGRINLIGEHIDYNGGLVFPLAITIGTYGILRKRQDSKILLFSKGFSEKPYEVDLENLVFDKDNFWVNYCVGMIKTIKDLGNKIEKGFELYIYGNIPNGAGLSSSASLEMLIGYIISDLNDLNISRPNLAIYGQKVENDFIGLKSGIMDQFIIANGVLNKALLLNTGNLEFSLANFNLGENDLVVGFTNKKRTLADSKYNERFSESMQALEILRRHYNVNNLCELTFDQVKPYEKELGELLFRRVRHIVTEQQRTKDFYEALNKNDLDTVCKILIEGHNSLKDDYEVTGIELDTLVYEGIKNGAIGARQTGAGFGGCMIAIVPKQKVKSYIEKQTIVYKDIIGYEPTFYVVESSDGVYKKQ